MAFREILIKKLQDGQNLTEDEFIALKEYVDAGDFPGPDYLRDTIIRTIEKILPSEGMDQPQAIVVSQTPPEEIAAANFRTKYPNMPDYWDVNTVNAAGWHLDFLFSDPVGFWKSSAAHWNTLDSDIKKGYYQDDIRQFTIDTIPPEWYLQMFNVLDVAHVNFAIQHFFPEHGEYLAFRWVAGPDNQLEQWVRDQVAYTQSLLKAGDNETAAAWRDNTVSILKTHNPEFMKAIPKPLQAEFIGTMMPEVIDQIDAAAIDTTLANANAKTIMIAVGGIILLVGGIAAVGQIGKKKQRVTTVPAK